jgi:hypothetical protein
MRRRTRSAASAQVRGNRGGGLEAGDGHRAAFADHLQRCRRAGVGPRWNTEHDADRQIAVTGNSRASINGVFPLS